MKDSSWIQSFKERCISIVALAMAILCIPYFVWIELRRKPMAWLYVYDLGSKDEQSYVYMNRPPPSVSSSDPHLSYALCGLQISRYEVHPSKTRYAQTNIITSGR